MKKLIIALLFVGLIMAEEQQGPFYKSFTTDTFNELDGWTVVKPYKGADVFTKCGNIQLFGGHGVFGATTLVVRNFKLPPHHTVSLKVQFWKIDSWDNEVAWIYADENIIFEKNYNVADGQQICGQGSNWHEHRENIDIKFAHGNNSVTIVFVTSLNEAADNESFAFRDFFLDIVKCPEKCHTCKYGQSEAECAGWELFKWSWTKDDVSSEGWNLLGGNDRSYDCAGVYVYGGFANFGNKAAIERQFSLPPHYRIKIKLTYLKIDSWDNEWAYVDVDGVRLWQKQMLYNYGYPKPLCGGTGYLEAFLGVEADGSHEKENIVIQIGSTVNEAPENESWGVRDFFIYFARCAKSCSECNGPSENDCIKCQDNWAVENGKCVPLVNFIILEQSFQNKKFTGINDWSLTKNKGERTTSQCGEHTLVGGYDVFGAGAQATKMFNIPEHSRIRLMVQLWKIDSWDDEWLFINVDGVRLWEKQIGFSNGGKPICGSGTANWNELILDVDEIFEHTDPKLIVAISATINQDAADESWGFREFRLFYEAKEQCAIFYTECNYKGNPFEFCGESKNFREDGVPPNIRQGIRIDIIYRSIKLPPQGTVTLYQNTDFGGKSITYKKSVECIKSYEFALNQMSVKIQSENQWMEAENSLRKTL